MGNIDSDMNYVEQGIADPDSKVDDVWPSIDDTGNAVYDAGEASVISSAPHTI